MNEHVIRVHAATPARVCEGPARCHGWTVFAIGDDGRRRCLYCLLEATIELRHEQTRELAMAALEEQEALRKTGAPHLRTGSKNRKKRR